MDSNKQNLTPELKAIYDRVMNTPVGSPPGGNPPAPGSTPPTPTPPQPPTPSSSQPPPPTPSEAPPVPTPATPPESAAPLPSIPPRQIDTTDKPFVFSASNKQETKQEKHDSEQPQPEAASTNEAPKKKLLSPPVMALGGVAFLILYAVIWLKIFKFF